MTRNLGDVLPELGPHGKKWTRSEKASWEAAGSPEHGTPAFEEWERSFNEGGPSMHLMPLNSSVALSADEGGNIAALLNMGLKPGSAAYIAWKYRSTALLNAAQKAFQERNGDLAGFIQEKQLEDPDVDVAFLENIYNVAQSSFEAQALTKWVSGGGESLGLDDPRPPRPTPSIDAITSESADDIAMAFGAISSRGYRGLVYSPVPAENPFEWWKRAPYDPWLDTSTDTYNITVVADGSGHAGLHVPSVGAETAGSIISIDNYLRATKEDPDQQQPWPPPPGPEWEAFGSHKQLLFTYEGFLLRGINEDDRLQPPQVGDGRPWVTRVKYRGANSLLQYLDKQGIGDPLVCGSLANKAVITNYAPGPSGVVFKVTIHRAYLDVIDKNIRDQFSYELLFGEGSYYNHYWQQEVWLTAFGKKLSNFKQAMTDLDTELKEWKAQGNMVEPEDFSFLQEYKNFEAFIKVDDKQVTNLGGAVGNFLQLNQVNFKPDKIQLAYDDKYLLKGITVADEELQLHPLFVAFEKFINLPASSVKNVSYLANMERIIDDQRNKKGFVAIAKQYILPKPKFIEFMEAKETPGVKTLQELQQEDRMLQDPILRSQVYERARKREYDPDDPTFTFLDRTIGRITSISDAYDVFLNRYGLEWVGKQILECVMNIIGLGFRCETRLKMVLEHLGVEEFRTKVLLPYAQWAATVGGQVLDSHVNTYAGAGKAINQLVRFKEEDYYQNLYFLENPPPGQTPADRNLLLQANQEIAQEIQDLKSAQEGYREHANMYGDSAQFFESLNEIFTIEEICEVLRELLDALIDFITNPEFTLSDFKFPKFYPTLDLPEKLPTINLFEAIARIAEEAVFKALEQIAVQASIKMLTLISRICNDLKISVNAGWPFNEEFVPSDPPSIPLTRDDLNNLLNDLFGDTETPSSLMAGLDELLDAFDGETDVATALENILDQITSQISNAELCQLIGGTAAPELLRKVKDIFDTVPVLKRIFTDTERVGEFFKAAGLLVSPDFCDALLNVDDAMIEDLCDLPPGSLFEAWQRSGGGPGGGGVGPSAQQLKDELKDLMDELAKQLASDGNHNDAVAPLIDECTPPPPREGEPPRPETPPPVVDWKRVPVIENANNVAISTFYHDVNARYTSAVPQMIKNLSEPQLVVNYNPDGPVNDAGQPITWTNHVQQSYRFTRTDEAAIERKYEEVREEMQRTAIAWATPGGSWYRSMVNDNSDEAITNDSEHQQDPLWPTQADVNRLIMQGFSEVLIREHIRKWYVWGKMNTLRNLNRGEGIDFVQFGPPGTPPPTVENGGLDMLMSLTEWPRMIAKARAEFPGPGITAPPVETIVHRNGLSSPGAVGPYTVLDLASIFLSNEPGMQGGAIIRYPSELDYTSTLEGQSITLTVTSPRTEGLVPINKLREIIADDDPRVLYRAEAFGVGEEVEFSSELRTNDIAFEQTLDFRYPAKDFVGLLPAMIKEGFQPNADMVNPSYPGLRIKSSPRTKVLDLVDVANQYDGFRLNYKRTVEVDQYKIEQRGSGPPGGLVGVEEYETVYQDYYTDPNGSSTSKTLLFVDALKSAVQAYIPDNEVDPVAVAEGDGDIASALYARALSGIMASTFETMVLAADGLENPFFSNPAELPSLELIPSSNPRIQRARGVVPVSVRMPDETVKRVFVKMGSKEAAEILATPNNAGLESDIGSAAARGDLLSLDSIKEKVKNDFLASPFCDDPDDPFANKDLSQLETAATAGIIYLILRVYMLEFLLKIAPVLVNFRLSDIFKSNVVPLYIIQSLKSDISQDEVYYCEFKKGVDKIIMDMGKKGTPFRDPVMGVDVSPDSNSATLEEKLVFLLKNQVLELEREYNYIIEAHKISRQKGNNNSMPLEWASVKQKTIAETICPPGPAARAGIPTVNSIQEVPPSYFYRPGTVSEVYSAPDSAGSFYFERYMRVEDNENSDGEWGRALNSRPGGPESRRNSGRLAPPPGHHNHDNRERFMAFVSRADLQNVVNYEAWQDFMENNSAQGTTVGGYFNKLAYGVRLVYVAKSPEDLSTLGRLFPSLTQEQILDAQLGGAARTQSIREKALYVTEVGDPTLEAAASAASAPGDRLVSEQALVESRFPRIVIPIASAERDVPLDFAWTNGVQDVEAYRGELPAGDTLWESLQQQVIDSDEYKRLMGYTMAADRAFGSSFMFAESFVSNKYYQTEGAFSGLKSALRLLYLLMIDENPFGNKGGRCDSDWGLEITGIEWEDLLDDMGLSAIGIITDTVLAAVLAILQLAGAMIDPFGLLKMILCPVIPTDGTFGGMGNKLKKAWDCPDFPPRPEWPEFSDNSCDPTANKEVDEECKVEVPKYFRVESPENEG